VLSAETGTSLREAGLSLTLTYSGATINSGATITMPPTLTAVSLWTNIARTVLRLDREMTETTGKRDFGKLSDG